MVRRLIVPLFASCVTLTLGLTAAENPAWAAGTDMSKVTGSIEVEPGDHVGNVSTVNGSIHIRRDATAAQVKTVNGAVHIEPQALVTGIEVTNGGIHVQGARVTGQIHAVNGGLDIEAGAEVTGDVANVNGGIHVINASVDGSIRTSSGNIHLGPNARIDGGVTMEADHSWHLFDGCPPTVVIAPGTVVKGTMNFERKVELYVSDRATIGRVEGANPVRFSGDTPPESECHR